MNPEYVTWLFGVSLAVSAIAIGCDLKWRRYPNWAYYASLALAGFFWYLFMRQEGWLADPQANAENITTVVIGLIFIFGIGEFFGSILHRSKFGGGDVKFMAVLSLLLPTAHVWGIGGTTYPQSLRYIPIDFWADAILFWMVFVLVLTLFTTLAWEPKGRYTVTLTPVIVAAFYSTIWCGGIWRGVVDPIVTVFLRDLLPIITGGG